MPEQGKYGTGIIFMDKESEESSRLIKFFVCFSLILPISRTKFSELAESLGLSVLAWREPPRDNTCLGENHVSLRFSN